MPDETNAPQPNDTGLREALAERTQMAQDLADQLRARDQQLQELRDKASRLERRGAIERSLARAGAIDTEALALLIENRLDADEDATPQRVIASSSASVRRSSAPAAHAPRP